MLLIGLFIYGLEAKAFSAHYNNMIERSVFKLAIRLKIDFVIKIQNHAATETRKARAKARE